MLWFWGYRAGDGNRTRVPSLGSSCSTIELHPLRGQNSPRFTFGLLLDRKAVDGGYPSWVG